ncbi:MAG: hypothetical protein ACRD22_17915, partial [Terriglobia bacterium]
GVTKGLCHPVALPPGIFRQAFMGAQCINRAYCGDPLSDADGSTSVVGLVRRPEFARESLNRSLFKRGGDGSAALLEK